jgi:putative NADPH-quinone reductase
MNALVVVCNPKKDSFNHGIAKTAIEELKKKGYKIFYHDLYEEKFDPILLQDEIDIKNIDDVKDEYVRKTCKEVTDSDILVVVHPNWWGEPPAMLKGWIDRIFRVGVVYKFDNTGKAIGLLKTKKAYIFNTSNTPEPVEMNVYKDPLNNLWKTCIFGMCGVKNVERVMFKGVIKSTEDIRKDWLKEVVKLINEN